MTEDNLIELKTQETFEDALTDVLRNGARRLLTDAVEAEVDNFLLGTTMFWTTNPIESVFACF